MEVRRKSSWLFLLLGLICLAVTLQGVQGGVESEGPSESECRPYIEKALKELETADTKSPGDLEGDSKEDVPTVEITTDDSDHEEDDGDNDDEEEGTDSTETVEQEEEEEEAGESEEKEAEDNEQSTEQAEEALSSEAEKVESEEDKTEEEKEEEEEEEDEEEGVKEEEEEEEEEEEGVKEEEEAEGEKSEEAEGEKSEEAAAESAEDTEGDEAEDEQAEGEESEEEQAEDEQAEEEQTEGEQTEGEQAEGEQAEEEQPVEDEEAEEEEEKGEETEEDEQQAESQEEGEISAEKAESEEAIPAQTESAEDEQESGEAEKASAEEDVEETEKVKRSIDDETQSAEAAESAEEKEAAEDEKSAEIEGEQPGEDTHDDEESKEGTDSDKGDEAEGSKEEEDDADTKAGDGDSKEADASSKEDDTVVKEGDEEDVKESAEEQKDEDKESGGEEKTPSKEEESVEEVVQEKEEGGESEEASEESAPEEELIDKDEVPTELRLTDHISQLLKLDEENLGAEKIISNVAEITLRELKKIYENAIKPLEVLYKYRDLSNRHFGDAEIFSKPLVVFMGPWSGGKSSIINYLIDNEYNDTSLRTGAEPSPAYFNILMYGEEPEVLDGTQLAADFTFSGLQKFGQGLEERLRGLKLPKKLLEKMNLIEIPGILEVRKQVSRVFPFNDACQWFIDRADIIFLVYDPSKLDVGPETEAILDQLKGREHQTRIILNKADQVKPEELMRVQGALIWNISPLMSSAQPPVMYTTSLWSRPYEPWAPVRLLQAQERAFLRDLRSAIDKRIENKIASARRFAVRVRNHAKMVDCYLTTYYNHKSVFGNRKQVSDAIIEHPQDYHIYEGLSTLTNISRYDLPDPDVYRDFFRLNPLYDFQQLSATCTYFRGCPINRLDVAIAYDLPELVGKHKRMLEAALAEVSQSQTPGS